MRPAKNVKKKVSPVPQPKVAVRPEAKPKPQPNTTQASKIADEATAPNSVARPWYIALLIASTMVLIATALLAFPGIIPGWEQRIFSLINGMEAPTWVANHVAGPISDAMPGILILIVVFLLIPRFRRRAWQYATAAGGAFAGTYLVEHIVQRLRPGDITQEVILRLSQGGYGFPSTHVAIITALGLTIWPLVQWPWRVLIVLFVGAEAWSRVFLGVHAPLDIIGGAAVGGIVVAVLHLLPLKIKQFFWLAPKPKA